MRPTQLEGYTNRENNRPSTAINTARTEVCQPENKHGTPPEANNKVNQPREQNGAPTGSACGNEGPKFLVPALCSQAVFGQRCHVPSTCQLVPVSCPNLGISSYLLRRCCDATFV
jgi:hypothetical protein